MFPNGLADIVLTPLGSDLISSRRGSELLQKWRSLKLKKSVAEDDGRLHHLTWGRLS